MRIDNPIGLQAALTGSFSGSFSGDGSALTSVGGIAGSVVGTTDTQTLTNKRVNPRVGTTTSTSSLTVDSDSYDVYCVTALAAAMTVNSPSGTPVHGQKLIIRIKDNGTARGLTWNAIFRVIGTELPITTTISKYIYIGCIYNTTDSKWDVVAVAEEA